MTAPASLPHVDEHATVVAAPPDAVWGALLATLDSTFAGPVASGYARAVGCADTVASGPRPLTAGSTVPGFRVVRATGSELVLGGRHRFSRYVLRFALDPAPAHGTRLRAETRAEFPGVAGGLYRVALLRTGAHVVAVRRLLAGVRRRAERDGGSSPSLGR